MTQGTFLVSCGAMNWPLDAPRKENTSYAMLCALSGPLTTLPYT